MGLSSTQNFYPLMQFDSRFAQEDDFLPDGSFMVLHFPWRALWFRTFGGDEERGGGGGFALSG